ncbi:ankyrin repeat-containing domain protein [Chaetomium strumarium]|uniref:Ankyrin repeat-containing domain protein n=1 Tax=Chaetomium strumarium TaxID=1170767 RepID=A0AAJ0GPH3_9PEZI|nr:ankyrin repeat-containing domain protein [Chaetomium strumarium]
MAGIRYTTLSVRRHQAWDDSHSLDAWPIQEESLTRTSYPRTPRVQAVPKRLRKTECRQVFFSNTQSRLPSIHVHGPQCRCTQTQTSDQHQDELLAQRIASLTEKALLARTTPAPNKSKPPPPPPTAAHPHRRPRPVSVSSGMTTSLTLLSTSLNRVTRLFTTSPQPVTPPPPPSSLALQAAVAAAAAEDLCIACANLDIDKVSRYLLPTTTTTTTSSSPAALLLPANQPNHLGLNPLMATIRSRVPRGGSGAAAQREMVRFLVEVCGADVNASRVDRVTGLGESVLSMACAGGLVEVVRYLVTLGERRRGRGRGVEVEVDRRLPLLVVGGPPPCRRPSSSGISGKGKGKGLLLLGQTALHVAVLADRAECVEVLVGEGKADVDAVFDGAGFSGEGWEGYGGLRGRARSVSSRESRRLKGPRHPVSALHLAHASVACTKVLLRYGAAVDARDGYGRTPLHWAAESGHTDVARLLVEAGADVSAVLKHGPQARESLSEALGMSAKDDSESGDSTDREVSIRGDRVLMAEKEKLSR